MAHSATMIDLESIGTGKEEKEQKEEKKVIVLIVKKELKPGVFLVEICNDEIFKLSIKQSVPGNSQDPTSLEMVLVNRETKDGYITRAISCDQAFSFDVVTSTLRGNGDIPVTNMHNGVVKILSFPIVHGTKDCVFMKLGKRFNDRELFKQYMGGVINELKVVDAGAAGSFTKGELAEIFPHPCEILVMVAGQMKSGKSAFINSLVGLPLCPSEDRCWTYMIWIVRYGPRNCYILTDKQSGAKISTVLKCTEEMPYDDELANVVEDFREKPEFRAKYERIVEVEFNDPRLQNYVFVDSPGYGEDENLNNIVTSYWERAKILIYVTKAHEAKGWSISDDILIRAMYQHLGNKTDASRVPLQKRLIVVANKADLAIRKKYREDRPGFDEGMKLRRIKEHKSIKDNILEHLRSPMLFGEFEEDSVMVVCSEPDKISQTDANRQYYPKSSKTAKDTVQRKIQEFLFVLPARSCLKEIYEATAVIHDELYLLKNEIFDWRMCKGVGNLENEVKALANKYAQKAYNEFVNGVLQKKEEIKLLCTVEQIEISYSFIASVAETKAKKVINDRVVAWLQNYSKGVFMLNVRAFERDMLRLFSKSCKLVRFLERKHDDLMKSPLSKNIVRALQIAGIITLLPVATIFFPVAIGLGTVAAPAYGIYCMIQRAKSILSRKMKERATFNQDWREKTFESMYPSEEETKHYAVDLLKKLKGVAMATFVSYRTDIQGKMTRLERNNKLGEDVMEKKITCARRIGMDIMSIKHNFFGGTITKGKFIGDGAFGKVHEATMSDGQKIALKIITYARQAEAIMIAKEIHFLKNVTTPYIPKYYGCFWNKPKRTISIFMELFDCSVYGVLEKKGLSDVKVKWRIALEIAKGMLVLHERKILHRDRKAFNFNSHFCSAVKAKNVLLSQDLQRVVITDFGVSQNLVLHHNTCCGTLTHMDLLVLSGQKGDYSYEYDVYSYGILLGFMLHNSHNPGVVIVGDLLDELAPLAALAHQVPQDEKHRQEVEAKFITQVSLMKKSSMCPVKRVEIQGNVLRTQLFDLVDMCCSLTQKRPEFVEIIAHLEKLGEEHFDDF